MYREGAYEISYRFRSKENPNESIIFTPRPGFVDITAIDEAGSATVSLSNDQWRAAEYDIYLTDQKEETTSDE
jgi:hypothetical protein